MTQVKRRISIPSRTMPTATSRLLLRFSPEGELVEFIDVELEQPPAPNTAPTPEPALEPAPVPERDTNDLSNA